jgi:hypothetical protein
MLPALARALGTGVEALTGESFTIPVGPEERDGHLEFAQPRGVLVRN